MTTRIRALWEEMIGAMGVSQLEIPAVCVKLYRAGETIPAELGEYGPDGLTLTCCQASRQAALGDPVLLDVKTIGCVAAAISLGLVDKNQSQPLGESLVYTNIMKQQSGL